jgi:predicted aspartyl protease
MRFLFFVAILCLPVKHLLAASCSVANHPSPSDADKALLAADYAKAAGLYQAALQGHPGDAVFTAGLVHALLHEQKVQEAADAVQAALAAAPGSAALISLRGEIEYRQGTPWLAAQSAVEANKLDPCNPRNHLLLADLERINSLYASQKNEIETAYRLDPSDPEIRAEWISTLPLARKIAEDEAYLAVPEGLDQENLKYWKLGLENMKRRLAEPHKNCRLVSSVTSTEMPFITLMRDAMHARGFGLDVKLNGHDTHLQIDTGAAGLVVSRSIAEHAGLKPFSQTEMGGIGDQGSKNGYTAYADSIRVGNLEFQNCAVWVLDSHSVVGVDGLIGMDVFSRFLVTLDFPMRKLLLGPLPKRPGDETATPLALNTSESDMEDSAAPAEDESQPVSGKDSVLATDKDSVKSASTDTHAAKTPTKKAARGPRDRYIAPEMKDYTAAYRVGHMLLLPTALNSDNLKLFIVDTGAMSTSISPQAAREVTEVADRGNAHVEGISGAVNNVFTADKVTFKFAHISDETHNVFSFDTSQISKGLGMEVSGFLGATTLGHLTIHIDYRDGLMKFDYDPNPSHGHMN